MIVSDLQFHSRFCVTSLPLEEASESWVCVRGGRFIINKLIHPAVYLFDFFKICNISVA